jgi:hypothetical protein
MTYDQNRLDTLGLRRARREAEATTDRPELHAQILAAAAAGVGVVEIARRASMTRDGVRQIVNKAKRAAGG